MKNWFVSLVILIVIGTGCRTAVSLPSVIPTEVNTVVLPTNQPTPTPLPPLPTVLADQSIQPTIQPLPLATTAPPIRIAVPPEWETAVSSAIPTTQYAWQPIPSRDGVQLLASGAVDIAAAWNAEGVLIFQEPIAFTVPFSTQWDMLSHDEAEEILANGHTLVTVQPWAAMSPSTRTLQVDGRSPADPEYPFQNRLVLVGAAGFETAVADLASQLQSTHLRPPLVQLAAVGDIMLDRALGTKISAGDIDYPFANIALPLQQADLTIGNVESALGNIGTPADKAYPFRAPVDAALSLAHAGFDIVSLANNHAMDYGPDALLQAITLLKAAGVTPVGAGENVAAAHTPYITERNGLRLAFLSYVNVPVEYLGFDTQTWTATADTPGLAWATPEQIMMDVTAVSSQVDHVIVLLHSAYEYVESPSPPQMAAARAAIDAGAVLVIGHHAHILQGIEFYRDGVIIYGTGNFAFEIDGEPETAVFNIWLDQNGIRQIELIPAIIQFGGQPRLATENEAAEIRQKVYQLTDLLN
jgi:poly-gamma-glutamate capsule biosynthesis protein CapA/YwtB (metallophosphatase superfamily)